MRCARRAWDDGISLITRWGGIWLTRPSHRPSQLLFFLTHGPNAASCGVGRVDAPRHVPLQADEAVASAVKEFELQGYDLSGVIRSATGTSDLDRYAAHVRDAVRHPKEGGGQG